MFFKRIKQCAISNVRDELQSVTQRATRIRENCDQRIGSGASIFETMVAQWRFLACTLRHRSRRNSESGISDFVKVLTAGLQLRQDFPNSHVKLRVRSVIGEFVLHENLPFAPPPAPVEAK
jgi:hypothetical protein